MSLDNLGRLLAALVPEDQALVIRDRTERISVEIVPTYIFYYCRVLLVYMHWFDILVELVGLTDVPHAKQRIV